jgi:hypothetical protein
VPIRNILFINGAFLGGFLAVLPDQEISTILGAIP